MHIKLSQDLTKAHLPSWYFKLERNLLSLGFDTSLIGEHAMYDTIATRLQDQHIQQLYCHIHCKTGVSSVGGNKLRFYSKIIDTVHNQEAYLSTITNPLLGHSLTRLRISCHNLNIEWGRYSHPRVLSL